MFILGKPEGWRLTSFYKFLEVACRKESWSLLQRLKSSSNRHWLYIGDFNEVLVEHEKQGQLHPQWWKIKDFWSCLIECDLHDMRFVGLIFMWGKGENS
ncbi:hypothetical protein Sango_1930300 [Sesamum angolense]|uniref:Uncharacterized protein n=1 Tax=Sesamum angolense TaxID=2727404 RepID=A0AAE1WDX9_9LAMI|nr:hypothetical protein Sango_1930300 [Sesamum angolense]